MAYARWCHWRCGWTQLYAATINQFACPSYSFYVQLLWYPMYYPEGMKARVSPVQWSKPNSILAPTQDSNPGGRIQNHKRWPLHYHCTHIRYPGGRGCHDKLKLGSIHKIIIIDTSPELWISGRLPDSLKHFATSRKHFRKELKTYLFRKAYAPASENYWRVNLLPYLLIRALWLRICENLMGAFLKVGGFEPTQTHPWPRHYIERSEV